LSSSLSSLSSAAEAAAAAVAVATADAAAQRRRVAFVVAFKVVAGTASSPDLLKKIKRILT
jgi:hypothetical protein